MTQVDRITEDIAHMPVAAFIFRDKESDEVHYSTDIRYIQINSYKRIVNIKNPRDRMSPALVMKLKTMFLKTVFTRYLFL